MMGLMNDKSKAAAAESTPKYEMKTINIINIIENPANSKIYSTENIEQLADSVELAGRVLQNLVVKPADENGKYMLISGHRRWMACKQLVSKGKLEFATVQCLIENEEDDQLQELMLIYTNSTARELNDAEKARQAERATAILTEMKKEKKLEGRVRDIVASMLKTTSGQLARYHAIMNNLKDAQLKEAFEKGELGVSVAYEASTLSKEGQKKIALQMQDGTVTLQNVTEVKMEERSDSPEWQERMKRIEQHREEDRRRAEETEGTDLNTESGKIKRIQLDLPKSSKVTAEIRILEEKGKYYAAHGVTYPSKYAPAYTGSYPSSEYDMPYGTQEEAFKQEINKIAGIHENVRKTLEKTNYKIFLAPTEPADTEANWKEHQANAWLHGNDGYWHFSPTKNIGFTMQATAEKTSQIGGTGNWIMSCAIQNTGKEPGRFEILRDEYKTEEEALDAALRHAAKKGMKYARPLTWYLGELIEPEDGKEDAHPENGKEDHRKDLERQAMAVQVIIDFLRFKKEDQEKAAKTAEKLDNQEGAKNFREVAIQLQEMIADKEDEARFMKESIQRI